MAEDGPLLNFFPDPPPFFKHFTAENLARLKEAENAASNGANTTADEPGTPPKLSPEQILALPTELRYLIPPAPPSDDASFHVFGESTKSSGTNNFTQTMEFISKTLGAQFILSDWEYKQLYPSVASPAADTATTAHSTDANIDRQQYLNRFNRSILLEYISLLGVLTLDPKSDHKDRKLKHILTLVCNMHALINEYRPHQARETLIGIMEEQVRRKKAEIEGIKAMEGKVRGVFDGFGRAADDEREVENEDIIKDVVQRNDGEKKRKEAQREMWDAVDNILAH
ncbi:Mediator of RNA polymerase II transcription subunit 7 [Curvularia kusanoi]|uniref:Mediator of RNA polymerase II transcription subunit 7 n=1 Tax=Curvularia kusanoi TaxID=90978 RepID=A0A9P4W8A7_CURKU|nr:Mediator of RNA polymerase II transcription subunit 7 [Curvularia kusanoi]